MVAITPSSPYYNQGTTSNYRSTWYRIDSTGGSYTTGPTDYYVTPSYYYDYYTSTQNEQEIEEIIIEYILPKLNKTEIKWQNMKYKNLHFLHFKPIKRNTVGCHNKRIDLKGCKNYKKRIR